MTTVYVKEQGAEVRRQGERLVISKSGSVVDELPLANLDQLILLGNVQMSTQAMATMMDQEIDVVFMSSRGKFRGRLNGIGSKHARLRQRQLLRLSDTAFALPLARAVVDGKINNQRTLLLRQKSRTATLAARQRGMSAYPADPALFRRGLKGMQQMQQQLVRAPDLNALRGYEGRAGAFYFEAVRSLLDASWGFRRRAYYPPPDPFNALLSFGYSLLLKDVLAAVNLVGFDPYLGFFHAVDYGRPSLALDLMEEWRPVLTDALALELVNRGSLKPDTFVRTGNRKRPVELGEDGVRLVLEAYERRLETANYHPMAGPGGQTTLRKAIVLQVRMLAQVVLDKRKHYEPWRTR